MAAIGSSDFHVAPALAACRTFLFARERTAAGVLEAIRSGRTVALDETGQLHGDPEWVQVVRRTTQAEHVDVHARWRRMSVALAWVGLLGLMVFGR